MTSAGGAVCFGCGATLAGPEAAIDVDGHRRRTFANPAGQRFEVKFFADAPGCAAGGPATDEATWFSGYTWQRAFCRTCATHAGWLFRGKARVFWALIASPA